MAESPNTGSATERIERVRAELARWGFGDFHYGAQEQEQSVKDALAELDEVAANYRLLLNGLRDIAWVQDIVSVSEARAIARETLEQVR